MKEAKLIAFVVLSIVGGLYAVILLLLINDIYFSPSERECGMLVLSSAVVMGSFGAPIVFVAVAVSRLWAMNINKLNKTMKYIINAYHFTLLALAVSNVLFLGAIVLTEYIN